MNSNLKANRFSPQLYARIGGLLYLSLIVIGMFSVIFIRNRLIVSLNAEATANNIRDSEFLWRIGIVLDLVMHVLDIPIMLIIYTLLKPTNRNIALLALLFNLIQTAVLVANKLNLLMPLFLLGNEDYLKTFDVQQLHSLTYISLKAHDFGFGLGLIFFGFVCLINGYLIIKSGYFPKVIGVMLQIAGVCYLINNFTLILNPSLANKMFPFMMIPVFIAETAFALRLTVKGVNLSKWELKKEAAV
jgi:hypothetical protein